MRKLTQLAALGALLLGGGCEEGPEPPEEESEITLPPVTPPDDGPIELSCDPTQPFDPGFGLVRRLNRLEYDNTVRDLLGDNSAPARTGFPADERSLGFDNNASALQASPLHIERFLEASEDLASAAVAQLDNLLPAKCLRDATCAQLFIKNFGLRAWRRPLQPNEIHQLMAVFEAGEDAVADLGGTPFEAGLSLVLQSLLQSPHFLYRIEVGTPDPERPGLSALSSYELASRLSYLLWRSMPDDELFALAARDELRDLEVLAAQTRRMMADDRAKAALWDFVSQWLGLNDLDRIAKDEALYPQFDDTLKASMLRETELFVQSILETGDMRRLFDADYTFMDAHIAALYGAPAPGGDAFYQVPTGPERAGVLTHPSLLSLYAQPNLSSPILRGIFIREKLLCHPIPAPPPNLTTVAPDPDPSLTTRELFRAHTEQPSCQACHTLIDPVGFGFERFDTLGQYRTEENLQPIDNAGELTQTRGLDGPFDSVAELADRLADSRQVHECVTLQMFRFAFGRGEQMAVDGCTLTELHARYAASGYNLVTLMEHLTTSEAFRYRRSVEAQ